MRLGGRTRDGKGSVRRDDTISVEHLLIRAIGFHFIENFEDRVGHDLVPNKDLQLKERFSVVVDSSVETNTIQERYRVEETFELIE